MSNQTEEPIGSTTPADAGGVNRTSVRLMTTEQAAELLNVSPKALAKWRVAGCGPKFICLSKAVRYTEEDLRVFIEESRYSKTAGKRARRRARGEADETVEARRPEAA